MNRLKTLAAAAGACAVLAAGQGCAMFDPWDDGDSRTTEYRREGPPQLSRTAGVQQPAEVSTGQAPVQQPQAGVYPNSQVGSK